jgi:hypothetical protein
MPKGSRDDVKVVNWDDNDAKRDVVETVAEDDKSAGADNSVAARSKNAAKRDVNENAGVDKGPRRKQEQERRK